MMEKLPFIEKAESIISSVKGKPLSSEERIEKAIALAGLMIEEADRTQTPAEKNQQDELAGMMEDPIGKTFITALTDQCFRSHRVKRIANQLIYLIQSLGIPSYLPLSKRLSMKAFAVLGKKFAPLTVPLMTRMIRKETERVIIPGEAAPFLKHMSERYQEGVRINLNHLGEAILGENEAKQRIGIYLDDLARSEVEYISVKISTIFSQINLLAWHESLAILSERLRLLYRAAMKHRYRRPDGQEVPKFVNLDMEEYRDLHLTVALFCQVLDEPEFYHHKAGIVLQSYLPDSFLIQQKLTVWAMQRLTHGGAPIKIRLVKGANLAMEQVDSALHLWPQAPYTSKEKVDANFKRMLIYGCQKHHAQAAQIGVGSHNLFDIAFALLLRAENQVEPYVSFEMLEGMADHIRRAVQKLSGEMLLYCPVATKEQFQNAVAYLVRRLDENTAPQNFLRQAFFNLRPGTPKWNEQAQLFASSCRLTNDLSFSPRRSQNRSLALQYPILDTFENESNTDWSLQQNRRWAEKIVRDWHFKTHPFIPLVIDEKHLEDNLEKGVGEDPSYPGKALYRYALASKKEVEEAIATAEIAKAEWSQTSLEVRKQLLANLAAELNNQRGDLIGAMMADGGKTIFEADYELSEAVDFAQFYRLNLGEWHQLPDIQWKPKGTVLVAPPWNFPCSIAAGGIIASLAAGNCVIFKPAPEAVLVAWHLVQIFWKAGFSQKVLQFVNCNDEPEGSLLVADPRISSVVLTGGTDTAKKFLKMRPGIDLIAETGGKNIMVISGMSDHDLAIKDLLQSAFGHAGQKCSACSLAILEAEVYDDPLFLNQLKEAAISLTVDSQWNFAASINPLIRSASPILLRGLTELEKGESWLLQPQQDLSNPQLWSPGIKLGVKPSSFTFQQELFGPVLGLVRAKSFEDALEMINLSPYGLTAGIHSLDEREQKAWLDRVEAGNCYINRTITGAVVERQPFGGCKESSFGKGAKAGGPNYLVQLMEAEQIFLPSEQAIPSEKLKILSKKIDISLQKGASWKNEFDPNLWKSSVGSYAFFWNEYFSKAHDPSRVLGQDNFQTYTPHPKMTLRAQVNDSFTDVLRMIAAASTCGTPCEISVEDQALFSSLQELAISQIFPIMHEPNEEFALRVSKGGINRIRLLQPPPPQLLSIFAEKCCNLNQGPVMANGRLELLQYLREVSISFNYHRYGNLGSRENEKRTPLICPENDVESCPGCHCHE